LKITKFEEIIAWQKSQDFAVNVYEILEPLKDYDFKRQIQRASRIESGIRKPNSWQTARIPPALLSSQAICHSPFSHRKVHGSNF
jgi:hypothetical protein